MLDSLDTVSVVTTPVGVSVVADSWYRDCVIKMNDHELRANLVPLEICEFGIILGMSFLAENHATFDYYRKRVMFERPGEPKIILNGERRIRSSCVISALDV